jgi:LuxR family maltose regulon positive regulatory protein
MNPTDPILRTKLHIPFTRPGLVPRPRLVEKIKQGLRGPLTLITAPAGFGKTTLSASAVAGCGLPAAWLSLEAADNQAGRFLNYLAAALQSADQRIGGEAAQLLAEIQEAPPETVLTSLINDLDLIGTEIVLVLDDYQLITTQAIHAAVAFLLDHRPDAFHLVIATRSDPPLPLARLRARGQTVELRAADLRFTAPEAAEFLNEVMGLSLDAQAVAVLEERTEGWAAGLQMAALSMRDRKDIAGFIQGFSGTNRYILDYLMEEILANQPPEIKQFLLCTSILERLTAPLCEAILAGGEGFTVDGEILSGFSSQNRSASILEYLERENLFLMSLDEERSWFRYHRLFADLLRIRLQQQAGADLISRLHVRASAWLEENGFIADAIRHLCAANEIGRAADLIERYGLARWAESDLSVVQMTDALPPEMLIERPKIGFCQAWLAINQGHVEKAFPLLIALEQRFVGKDPDAGQHWLKMIVDLALAFLGKPGGAPPGFAPLPDDRALDEIPPDEIILRQAADILYGMALGRRGEIDRAAEFSLKCMQKETVRPASQAVHPLIPFLTTIYLFQGQLRAAADLCHQYLDPIKDKGIRITTVGNMDVVLGNVLYEWNRLDEAEEHIRDGLRANEPWGNIMTDAFGLLTLAQVLQARGEFDEAILTVEKLESRLAGQFRPIEFEGPLRTQRVRIQLAGGDLQTAFQWADQICRGADYSLHQDYYTTTLARIRLAQGRHAEVEAILTEANREAGAGNRIVHKLEFDLIRAAALAGQELMPEALSILAACLDLAEPEGYIRVFLDLGEPVRDLLAAYLRSGASGQREFAQELLAAFSPARNIRSIAAPQAGLIEPLSPREMEVLRLMARGCTNPEIARELIVAPGTVKAHTASIFRKLDVSNRTEAAARARQLGLLL